MSTLSPRLARDNERFPQDSLVYHESIPIVFGAIPKVGCSTVKRWLIGHIHPDAPVKTEHEVHEFASHHFTLSGRSVDAAERILGSRPMLAFVRDPLDRLRGAFIDKFVRPETADLFPPVREVIDDLAALRGVRPDYDRRLTFREFVTYVTEAEESHLDHHWRPQIAFLRPYCNVFVLPIDRLTPTLNTLSDRLGRPDVVAGESNATPRVPMRAGCVADIPAGRFHRDDHRPVRADLVDDDITALVAAVFASDYALLDHARRTRLPELLPYSTARAGMAA